MFTFRAPQCMLSTEKNSSFERMHQVFIGNLELHVHHHLNYKYANEIFMPIQIYNYVTRFLLEKENASEF